MTRRTFHRLRRLRPAVLALLRSSGPLTRWQVAHRVRPALGRFVSCDMADVVLGTLAARGLAELVDARAVVGVGAKSAVVNVKAWVATQVRETEEESAAEVERDCLDELRGWR